MNTNLCIQKIRSLSNDHNQINSKKKMFVQFSGQKLAYGSGILEGIEFLNFAWKHIFSQFSQKENLIQIQIKPNLILINRCRSMYVLTYVLTRCLYQKVYKSK